MNTLLKMNNSIYNFNINLDKIAVKSYLLFAFNANKLNLAVKHY